MLFSLIQYGSWEGSQGPEPPFNTGGEKAGLPRFKAGFGTFSTWFIPGKVVPGGLFATVSTITGPRSRGNEQFCQKGVNPANYSFDQEIIVFEIVRFLVQHPFL